MDKYIELYNLAKKALEEQHNRYSGYTDKASKYLTVLTIVIGVYSYYIPKLYEQILPPDDFKKILLLLFSFFSIITLIIAWFSSLRIYKVDKLYILPLNNEMLEFFLNNTPIDIYYALSSRISERMIDNEKILELKSDYLERAYDWIKYSTISMILSLGIYIFVKLI